MGDKEQQLRLRELERGPQGPYTEIRPTEHLTDGQATAGHVAGSGLIGAGVFVIGAAVFLWSAPLVVAGIAGGTLMYAGKTAQEYVVKDKKQEAYEIEAGAEQRSEEQIRALIRKADGIVDPVERKRQLEHLRQRNPSLAGEIQKAIDLPPIPDDAPAQDVSAGSQTIAGDAGLKP